MPDVPKLFWPISRRLINSERISNDQIHRLRALITYQILFGGRLVIVDSDYVNNLAFRRALVRTISGTTDDHSRFIRDVIDERYLILARRRERSLGDIARSLHVGRSLIIPDDWYLPDAEDLVYLDSAEAPRDPEMDYSLSNAGRYYAEAIESLLSRPLEPYIDEDFRERAADHVAGHIARFGTLSWSFFSERGDFWTPFSEEDWLRHKDFFYRILGQGPYTGFIPATLGLNPIYMDDVAEAVDLWRGRHLEDRELLEERIIDLGNGFSFSDYVDYLSVLPFESVRQLSLSDEAEAFRESCHNFAVTLSSFGDLERFYREYRKRIDFEILRHGHALPSSGGKMEFKAFLRRARNESVSTGVDFLCRQVIGKTIPFWGLCLSIFSRMATGEWPEQKRSRLAVEATQRDLAGTIQKVQASGEKLRGKLITVDENASRRFVIESSETTGDVCVASGGRSGD